MSKEIESSKRKASSKSKDARPSKKVKATEEEVNGKLKAAADAKKSRKRAVDPTENEDASAMNAKDDSPKQKKVKISKKVEVAEPVPTSISKDKKIDKKVKKSKTSNSAEEKAVVVVEQEEEIALPEDDGDNEEEDDVAALLAGFSSDESDEEAADKEGLALDDLPGPKMDKKARKALAKAQKKAVDEDTPGTIYVGRIPHGFYEPQMRAYFTQFGTILHLRLSRNKKTGRSKHYAFIQFASSEVADIVARSMNNYLMFGHILKVRVVPEEQVHPEMWKGADKRFKIVPRGMLERKAMEKPKGRDYWEQKVKKESSKREKKRKAMEELGYEFNATELKKVEDVPMKDVEGAGGEVTAIDSVPADGSAEELVKAIEGATAVADDVTAEINKVIKDGKKTKKEKTKVTVSKKAKA